MENKSKLLPSLSLPSEVVYSTVVVDSLEEDIQRFDKVLLVSQTFQQQDISGFHWKLCVGHSHLFVSLYEKSNIVCDVTFVIQGPLHKHTPFTVLYTAPYGSICLGIWESDFEGVQNYVEQANIDNYYNKAYQILSTLKGLQHVKTSYCIKLRADEYFVNFVPFLTKLRSLPPLQILTSNIYFKKANDWPYHISDHIMGAKTECLVHMFTQAFTKAQDKTLLNRTPEVHLALSYLETFGPVKHDDSELGKILFFMYTYFDVFPIRLFEDYTFKAHEFFTKSDGGIPDVNTLESMSDFKVTFTGASQNLNE